MQIINSQFYYTTVMQNGFLLIEILNITETETIQTDESTFRTNLKINLIFMVQ